MEVHYGAGGGVMVGCVVCICVGEGGGVVTQDLVRESEADTN